MMVPTAGVKDMLAARGFRNLREWTHGVDTRLFAQAPEARACPGLGRLARPVSLCVGRVSCEKNIAAFLELVVPGSKVVCGVGPLQAARRLRDRKVHWLGVQPRQELAEVYAAADVFVFPGRSETFGLVMPEAMACGVPVAACPVDGPLQVMGDSGAGAWHEDLGEAWHAALKVPRQVARDRALRLGWGRAVNLSAAFLVPLPRPTRPLRDAAASRPARPPPAGEPTHKRHRAVE